MGLMSKILHKDKDGKDKHHDEDPVTSTSSTSGSNTLAQNKSYYTGPQSHADPSSTTAPGADTTTTGSHGLGATNNTAGSHGQFSDTIAGPHASNTGNRVDPRVDSDQSRHGGSGASHGQFSDTVHSGKRPGYENTPGAFPESGISSKPHVNRDGYGRTQAPGQPDYTGSDRHGVPGSSSGPGGYGAGTSANFSGRDPYPNTFSNSRDHYSNSAAPGPYGTREDYGPTGPASSTIGPHSSNAANVADPRVRPEPEKMRDHRTVGPHQSDMMNKIDPRVDSDPRDHGYASRDPYDDRNRYDTSDSRHSLRQTGGFVGGPHERLENRGSVPTAGGLPVGDGGNGPYDNMHIGSGSHGADRYESSRGGLTGPHGRDHHDSRANEPYGSNDRFGSGPDYGSGPGSRGGLQCGPGGASDLEIKERELALRHKELDLKEREQQLRRM